MGKRPPKFIREINKRYGLGPTNQFPNGKLGAQDDGELKIALGRQMETIIISFGRPIDWLGMTVDQARAFALAIIQKCDELPIVPMRPEPPEGS